VKRAAFDLLSKIITARGAGLTNGNTVKPIEDPCQPLPYPSRDVFTGRVLEAVDLIQVIVIKPLAQRFEGFGYEGVVDEPPGLGIDLSSDCYLTSE